ncbi:MAG TPA: hypothetical protein VE973_03630, partial [Candidatus Limnocylindria bacterium]|nr:hypothetical protein [Candidatus Limnocylindria bacterium]
MMRILLIAVVLAIAFSAGTAYATPIACTGPPVTVDVFPPAGPSAATFSCGGLLFSKFEVVLGSGNLTFGQIDLVSATNDNGDVVLN